MSNARVSILFYEYSKLLEGSVGTYDECQTQDDVCIQKNYKEYIQNCI